jgi:hypothetical protein
MIIAYGAASEISSWQATLSPAFPKSPEGRGDVKSLTHVTCQQHLVVENLAYQIVHTEQ